jgi:hypothetical protein
MLVRVLAVMNGICYLVLIASMCHLWVMSEMGDVMGHLKLLLSLSNPIIIFPENELRLLDMTLKPSTRFNRKAQCHNA